MVAFPLAYSRAAEPVARLRLMVSGSKHPVERGRLTRGADARMARLVQATEDWRN